MMRRTLTGLLPLCGVLAIASEASAQEVQVTGPLAGAPAVRNLRLHRKQRFELAPSVSFTLLDEYQQTMLVGARVNYNITDWLALGVWGGYGVLKITRGLTDKIQEQNDLRFSPSNPDRDKPVLQTARTLTAPNIGRDFKAQLGTIDWVAAPQITAVPFRGKLSIFEKIFVDTDAYFFVGPAFVGVKERKACGAGTGGSANCAEKEADQITPKTKEMESRLAIAPTFGLGLSFYMGKWMGLGFEWRGLPFARNIGGFDIRGGGDNEKFPDNKVDEKDREFKFNQMISISFNMYFPTELKLSE